MTPNVWRDLVPTGPMRQIIHNFAWLLFLGLPGKPVGGRKWVKVGTERDRDDGSDACGGEGAAGAVDRDAGDGPVTPPVPAAPAVDVETPACAPVTVDVSGVLDRVTTSRNLIYLDGVPEWYREGEPVTRARVIVGGESLVLQMPDMHGKMRPGQRVKMVVTFYD